MKTGVFGKGGMQQSSELSQPDTAQPGLSWGGGEKAAENQFLQAGPRDGHWGTRLINAAWSPAGTRLGVTLKSKHTQPNE